MFKHLVIAGALLGALLSADARAAQPDLLLADAHARDARRQGLVEAAAGGPAIVFLELENLGGADAVGVEVECSLTGRKGTISKARQKLRTIRRYTKRVAELRLATTGPAGRPRLRCSVDPDKRIKETNEANNRVEKLVTLKGYKKSAYRVEVSDFSPWTKEKVAVAGHLVDRIRVDFKVRSLGPGASAKSFHPARKALWQAECQLVGQPDSALRERNEWRELPYGELGYSGKTVSEGARLTNLYLMGRPGPEQMAAVQPMKCTFTVGAFKRSGGSSERWVLEHAWWRTAKQVDLVNPYAVSERAAAPLDFQVRTASASASRTRQEALDPRRNTWVRVRASVNQVPRAEVQLQCLAYRGDVPVGQGFATAFLKNETRELAVNLGPLPSGQYRFACELDPSGRFREGDRANNRREFVAKVP